MSQANNLNQTNYSKSLSVTTNFYCDYPFYCNFPKWHWRLVYFYNIECFSLPKFDTEDLKDSYKVYMYFF